MTNQQLYLSIGVPALLYLLGFTTTMLIMFWQSRGLEKRLDRLDTRLDRLDSSMEEMRRDVKNDMKSFSETVGRLKEKTGIAG